MHALASREAPAPAPAVPPLRVVETPARRRRPALDAWDVARFATGLTLGFLMAALASGPGGGAIVTGQLALAGVAATVAALAALRTRAVRARAVRDTRL